MLNQEASLNIQLTSQTANKINNMNFTQSQFPIINQQLKHDNGYDKFRKLIRKRELQAENFTTDAFSHTILFQKNGFLKVILSFLVNASKLLDVRVSMFQSQIDEAFKQI